MRVEGGFCSRPQSLRSRPEGAVFGAGKSGRSLQWATRGGACEYACARAPLCVLPGRVACVAAVCLHDEESQGSTGGTGRGWKETCFPASLLPPFPRVTFFAHPEMLFFNLLRAPAHPHTWCRSCLPIRYPEDAAVPLLPEGIPGIPVITGAPECPPALSLGRHSRGGAGVPQFALLPLQVARWCCPADPKWWLQIAREARKLDRVSGT